MPKIIFRYSRIYDGFLKTGLTGKKFQYPSEKTKRKILNYVEKVKNLWSKDEKKILAEISKITKLKWREKIIYCYVVEKGNWSFSDPLTISILPNNKKVDIFIDTLVHELIHRIFASRENFLRSKNGWKYIYRKYKNETEKTKIHIVIHAFHNYLYLKFYNEKRLKRDIQWAKQYKDYKRAWEIVQKEGYNRIIKEFTKRIQDNH